MKKITIYIVLAVLCFLKPKAKRPKLKAYSMIAFGLCLFIVQLKAQENKAVDVTDKGIQIGQKVPDITITGLHNYKDAQGKSASTAKLSDFKGKLLILDFWATWCGPCIGMIPKMDSLQKSFGNKIQFLSITYQTEKEVLPFMEKLEKKNDRHYDLPHLIADKELHKLFPHRELPHYVWIDKDGKLLSATSSYNVTYNNILKALNQNVLNMEQKTDVIVKYDRKEPLFSYEAFRKNIVMQSNISGYIAGIAGGMSQDLTQKIDKPFRKISIYNASIPRLYSFAYGNGQEIIGVNRILLNVADTTLLVTHEKGVKNREWKMKNSFCYELIVPVELKDNAWTYFKSDLDRFFYKYSVVFEKRRIKCYVLSRTSDQDKTKSKGGQSLAKLNREGAILNNAYLSRFMSELNLLAQQYSSHPLVDGTGLTSPVDIEIHADLSNIQEMNKALKTYDLEFILKDWEIEALIINDRL